MFLGGRWVSTIDPLISIFVSMSKSTEKGHRCSSICSNLHFLFLQITVYLNGHISFDAGCLFDLFIWFLHVQSYKHIYFVLVLRSASYNILHVLKTAKMKMQLPVIYNNFIDLNNFVEFETGQ